MVCIVIHRPYRALLKSVQENQSLATVIYHLEILLQCFLSCFRGRTGCPCVSDANGGSLHTEITLDYRDESIVHGLLVSVCQWKKVQRIEQAFRELARLGHKNGWVG